MSNIIPFDSDQLPAHLQGGASVNDALTKGVMGGFPVLSIKGKTFTIVSGDTRSVITKPDDPDEPASNIQVVILDANPELSKTYYESEYEEGSNAKPTCASDDGIKPLADVEEQQSKTCAACPHNAWGSGKNGRGKACQDARRLAVAPAGQLNEPMLLRVPPASLRPLKDYGTMLAKRGVSFDAVITKLRFEPGESSPKLIFAPVGFLDEDQYNAAQDAKADDMVGQITGVIAPTPAASDDDEGDEPAPKPKAKAKAKAKAKPDRSDDGEDDDPAPKAKTKAKSKPVVDDDDDDDDDGGEDDLDALLAGFDD